MLEHFDSPSHTCDTLHWPSHLLSEAVVVVAEVLVKVVAPLLLVILLLAEVITGEVRASF